MPKKDSKAVASEISDAELIPSPDESLGEYLHRLRLLRGLNLGDVSVRTPRTPESQHVSHSYLSQLELGRAQNPSRERLSSLARVYEVPEGWILEKAGFLSKQVDPVDELDPHARRIALRAAQLSPEERTLLDTVIDGILRARRSHKPSQRSK